MGVEDGADHVALEVDGFDEAEAVIVDVLDVGADFFGNEEDVATEKDVQFVAERAESAAHFKEAALDLKGRSGIGFRGGENGFFDIADIFLDAVELRKKEVNALVEDAVEEVGGAVADFVGVFEPSLDDLIEEWNGLDGDTDEAVMAEEEGGFDEACTDWDGNGNE